VPNLEPVPLPPGWTVHGVGDRDHYLCFLIAGVTSVTKTPTPVGPDVARGWLWGLRACGLSTRNIVTVGAQHVEQLQPVAEWLSV
jgi:hypothetical protein